MKWRLYNFPQWGSVIYHLDTEGGQFYGVAKTDLGDWVALTSEGAIFRGSKHDAMEAIEDKYNEWKLKL
jgi:hypothetical protein